jgi:hypothetical protein
MTSRRRPITFRPGLRSEYLRQPAERLALSRVLLLLLLVAVAFAMVLVLVAQAVAPALEGL